MPTYTASRGGLLTGRYPIRLGLVDDVARPTNDIHLAETEITIAEALKGEGYNTAMFGKWHLGSRVSGTPKPWLMNFMEHFIQTMAPFNFIEIIKSLKIQ